jgi:hypothetical protein
MKRAVRHGDALCPQAAVDLRQPEALGEPRGHLLSVCRQPLGQLPRSAAHDGADGGAHGRYVLVRRPGVTSAESGGRGGGHVLGDRLPVAARPAGDGAQTFPQAEAPQDFANFDHTQLPIGHDHLLGRG